MTYSDAIGEALSAWMDVDESCVVATARALVRHAESVGLDARLHPLGFVQFRLPVEAYDVRINVWAAGLGLAQDPEFLIHDHSFRVISRVIVGTLKDTQYGVKASSVGTHRLFCVSYDHAGSVIAPRPITVTCERMRSVQCTALQAYDVEARAFHRTTPCSDFVATIMIAEPRVTDPSRVVGPLAGEQRTYPRHALAGPLSASILEQIRSSLPALRR